MKELEDRMNIIDNKQNNIDNKIEKIKEELSPYDFEEKK